MNRRPHLILSPAVMTEIDIIYIDILPFPTCQWIFKPLFKHIGSNDISGSRIWPTYADRMGELELDPTVLYIGSVICVIAFCPPLFCKIKQRFFDSQVQDSGYEEEAE